MLFSKQCTNIPFKQHTNVCPLSDLAITPGALVALGFEIPVASSRGFPGPGKLVALGRTDVWCESYWQ